MHGGGGIKNKMTDFCNLFVLTGRQVGVEGAQSSTVEGRY